MAHAAEILAEVGAICLQGIGKGSKGEVLVEVEFMLHQFGDKDLARHIEGNLLGGNGRGLLGVVIRNGNGFVMPTIMQYHEPHEEGDEVINYISEDGSIEGSEKPRQLTEYGKEEYGFEPAEVDALKVGVVAAYMTDVSPELEVANGDDEPRIAP